MLTFNTSREKINTRVSAVVVSSVAIPSGCLASGGPCGEPLLQLPFHSTPVPAPHPPFCLPSPFFFLLPWLNLRIQVALAIVLYFRRSRQQLANKTHSKSNVTFFVPNIQTSLRFQLRSQERFCYYAEKPSKVSKQADCN